jgi:hypothetical protein
MKWMKSLTLLALLGVAGLFSGGCSTPAYTWEERHAQIWRNWDYELKQATDDWDHLLLLRPASRLTIWHVR